MAVNKAILVGNLGGEPVVKSTPAGQTVANFTMATNESWSGKDGQKQERTEWHRIVVWDKLAELCGKYLHKGKQVYVEGRLQTRQWQDKDGATRYTTEIVASTVQFLGGAGGSGGGEATQEGAQNGSAPGMQSVPTQQAAARANIPMTDDIPF